MDLASALNDSLASSRLRQFWLLTWLRVGLAILVTFLLALTTNSSDTIQNDLPPALIAGMYALASVAELWMLYYSRIDWRNQLFGQLLVDMLLIGLLMVSLGGGSGGYAILFMLPIAASSSLLRWSAAMFICSVSVLMVLADGLRRALSLKVSVDWVLLGLMGIAAFALMALLRFASERTRRLEKMARYAHTQALMTKELSDQHVKEETLGWLVLDEKNTVQLMNVPARHLAWQSKQLLEINQTIRASGPLGSWLSAIGQSTEQLIDWPARSANGASNQSPPTDQLFIKAAKLPHINGYTALTLELSSARTARNREQHLATMGRLSASIAHEIRNPLAAISQAAELLQESSALSRQEANLLNMMLTNSQRIDRIVHNLLGWSRGVQVNRSTFKPHETVTKMTQEICLSLHISRPRVSIRLAPEKLPEVLFDEDHLYQILSNLLSNAASYAQDHAGSISIELRPRGRFVALLVLDDGAAVAANIAENLFEPFQSGTKNGTGLGLFLCREYAQANEGSLQLMTNDDVAGYGLSWVQAPYTKAFVLNMPLSTITQT